MRCLVKGLCESGMNEVETREGASGNCNFLLLKLMCMLLHDFREQKQSRSVSECAVVATHRRRTVQQSFCLFSCCEEPSDRVSAFCLCAVADLKSILEKLATNNTACVGDS